MRHRLRAIGLLAFLALAFVPLRGRAATDEAEKLVIEQIKKVRGDHRLDKDGHIECICFITQTDGEIETINLGSLEHLRVVIFFGKPATKRSILHLQKIKPGLKSLDLINFSTIDERELERLLRKHKTLELLTISRTPITDQTLSVIGTLANLRILDLHETKVTDAGAKHLVRLQNLRDLELKNTNVTDATLLELVQCRKLAFIGLRDTKTTSLGFREICNLPLLHEIEISGTAIDDDQTKELQKDYPNTKFVR